MFHVPRIPFAEIFVDADLGVGLSIAIEVFAQPKMGWFSDQHLVVQSENRPGENQVIQESRGLIHSTVSIEIDQLDHPTGRFQFAAHVEIPHVTAHFRDVQFAIWSPSHANRLLDHGFRRNQFQSEPIRHPNRRKGIFGRISGYGRIGIYFNFRTIFGKSREAEKNGTQPSPNGGASIEKTTYHGELVIKFKYQTYTKYQTIIFFRHLNRAP